MRFWDKAFYWFLSFSGVVAFFVPPFGYLFWVFTWHPVFPTWWAGAGAMVVGYFLMVFSQDFKKRMTEAS